MIGLAWPFLEPLTQTWAFYSPQATFDPFGCPAPAHGGSGDEGGSGGSGQWGGHQPSITVPLSHVVPSENKLPTPALMHE